MVRLRAARAGGWGGGHMVRLRAARAGGWFSAEGGKNSLFVSNSPKQPVATEECTN